MIPPPPTADTKTSAWEPDASTAHARGGRARGVVAFLTSVLVAIGFLFGAGTAAIASVATTASEAVAEEACVGEETVASRRGALTRHRRPRSRTQRSEQPTGRWARRRLPSVPARSFLPAARRDEGPRSSLTDTCPSFGALGVALRRHVRPLSRHEERSHGSRSCSNRSARGVRRRRVRTNLGRRPVTGVHVVLGALLGAALGLAINCRAALARTSLRRAAPSGQREPAHPTYGAREPRRRAGRGRPRCPAESRGARSRTPVPAPAHPHTLRPPPPPGPS